MSHLSSPTDDVAAKQDGVKETVLQETAEPLRFFWTEQIDALLFHRALFAAF